MRGLLFSRIRRHLSMKPFIRAFSVSSPSGAPASSSSIAPKSPLVPYFEDVHELGQNGLDIEFDSWRTVQRLTEAGFTTKQSELITDMMCWILRVRLNEFKRSLVSQPQVEYDLAVMSEGFDEIQASFSSLISRDSVEIRGLTEKYASEIGRLLDAMKDSLNASKTDLAIAVNTFKADSLEEAQRVGMRLHQEDSKLTVRMGGFKTATENVKLRAIYMFSVVLCIACVMVAAKAKSPKRATKSAAKIDITEDILK